MRLIIITIFSLLFAGFNLLAVERLEKGNLILENVPEIPAAVFEKLNQYQNVRSASFVDWHPLKGLLITTRFGETAQLHLVSEPLGYRRQITFFGEPVSNGIFCPDRTKEEFVFLKDTGGNEFYQIFDYDLKSGKVRMLSDGKSRNGSVQWSPCGRLLAFTSTKRNGIDNDVYLLKMDGKSEPELVLQTEGSWSILDWSADGKMFLLMKYISVQESELYLFDLEQRKILQKLNPKKKIAYGGALFARDGKSVFYISDEESEFKRLFNLDLQSGQQQSLVKQPEWDVEDFTVSPDGSSLVYAINENGYSKLILLDLKTKRETPFEIGQVIVGGLKFSPDSSQLAITLIGADCPGDVYSFDLVSRRLIRWTESELGGLRSENFVRPELIHYETFDFQKKKQRRKIPAFVYLPRDISRPVPVIINIHGGPEAQSRPNFSSLVQFWVNELNVAVIFPNVRGSTGYGKTFVSLDNWEKREDSVKDIGALLDWIASRKQFDPERIAVYGGSYGGYMVLAAMFHFNQRIRCGVDIVGISNFVTFLESTQPYRRDLRRVEYGDERIPKMRDFLKRISPTTNAHRIKKPLFVIQGLNDPRVPYTEAEQIVREVRNNGVDVWYLLAKDEGHGFGKKSNRDFMNAAVLLFLEKFLLQ